MQINSHKAIVKVREIKTYILFVDGNGLSSRNGNGMQMKVKQRE